MQGGVVKKALVVLLFLVGFAVFPANARAQGAQFTSHWDFVSIGRIANTPVFEAIVGFHFTTAELGRVNFPGIGFLVGFNNKQAYEPNNFEGNLILTSPVSIRLTHNKDSYGNITDIYFNISYSYGLLGGNGVMGKSGVLLGFSLGVR